METNITKYLAILEVIQEQNFTKAAENLNYSQAAISKMIHSMEQKMGLTLFIRTTTRVEPTADALRILPAIQELCSKYRNLERQVSDITNLEVGTIRIGSFASAAIHWLPHILKEYTKRYPNIEFELYVGSYKEIEVKIKCHELDCAFLPLPTCDPELNSTYLESDAFKLVVPPGHPLTKYDIVPHEELNHYPFLLVEEKGDSEVTIFLEEHNLHPVRFLTTWDDYVTMSMVENGLGISILSTTILIGCPFDIVIKEMDVPFNREIGFVYSDQASMSKALEKFMRYLECR